MNTFARTAARRVVSNASRRTASTLRRGEEARRAVLPLMAAATAVGGVGYMTLNQQENNAQCLSGANTAEAVEEKFATYWPRNIMILFGPPVSHYLSVLCLF